MKDKEQIQMRMRILHNLALIVEKFPQYTLAQHMSHFMRAKGTAKDKYFWEDSFVLSRIEGYYDELCTDLEPLNTED